MKNILKRHIQLHNCTTKLLYIFLVGKFSLEFEEDTNIVLKNKLCFILNWGRNVG